MNKTTLRIAPYPVNNSTLPEVQNTRHASHTKESMARNPGAHPAVRSMPLLTNYYGKIIIHQKESTEQRERDAHTCTMPFGRPRSRRNQTSLAGLLTHFRLEAPSHPLLLGTVAIECLSHSRSSQQRDCPGFSPDSLLILSEENPEEEQCSATKIRILSTRHSKNISIFAQS